MNVSLFDYVWVLQILAGLLALSVFVRCARSLPKVSAVIGIVYAIVLCIFAWSLGVAGVWGGMLSANKGVDVSERVLESTLILPNGKILPTLQVDQGVKGWFNLSQPGQTLAAFTSISHEAGSVPIFYAGEGVHGSYVEDLKALFGDLSPLNSQEGQTVCYLPNEVLGFRDPRCVKRHATITIDAAVNQRLAVSQSGTVVATAMINGQPVVLLGYELDPSSSRLGTGEACLIALASGRACVVPAFLPADTQMAMLRVPSAYSDVLKEFGIPTVEDMPTQCLAGLESDFSRPLPNDPWNGFSEVNSEAALSRFLDHIMPFWMQAPIAVLQIPEITGASVDSSLPLVRSLVSTLIRSPLWIASCEQIRARLSAMQNIEGSILEKGRGFELDRLGGIERLSTYVVAPVSVYPRITAVEVEDDWGLYRLNDRVLKLVASTGALKATIDFNSGESGMALFSREMRLFLFIGLMFGGIAALIQSLAASEIMRVSPLPMGTALPVAGLLFVWLWYSYQYSLSMGSGSRALVAIDAVERPLLLSEVPDEFFFEASARDQSADLVRTLAELRDKIPQTPENLAVLKTSSQPKPVLKYQQEGKVILLNSLTARNFFYRKSPAYGAAVAAWEDMLNKEKIAHEIADDDTLESLLRSDAKLLIVPDARFVPASESVLSSWIERGGVVLFTDRLIDEDVESSERSARLLAASLGGATVTSTPWSSTPFLGSNLAIDGTHRVIRQSGQVSVLRGHVSGKGGIVFYGAHPGQGRARELSAFVVKNLTGQIMEVLGASECRALVAFEPYRLSPGEISKVLSETNASFFALAINSGSLPAMLASFSSLKDRIVIVDDGDWKNRYLSSAIFSEILQTQPHFISLNEKSFSNKGPAGDYRAGVFVSDPTPQKVYAALRESCRSSAPRPVVVGSDFVVKYRDFARKISQEKSIKFQSPAEFVAARPGETMRVIKMKTSMQDPLQFSEEVK